MDGVSALKFKIASDPWEFEQIHRLNYKTFVEEIPQHQANEQGKLVDRFHDENIYAICIQNRQVIGMMCMRDRRPFSLDKKLENLDQYLPTGAGKMAEIRLLATEKEHRGGRILLGLLSVMAGHLVANDYDLAIISGTTRQLKLYEHMGFIPFGPLFGSPGAQFQPMYITRERFKQTARKLLPEIKSDDGFGSVSFLPGPVDLTAEVRRAFAANCVSHRTREFLDDFHETQAALCRLVNAKHVQILTGSGTLANDVVAAQLSLAGSRGLILSNGEFGERLINHAQRLGLDFIAQRKPWGQPLDYADVNFALDGDPSVGWIWAVHCETSTGVLNDLAALKTIARQRNLNLCLDCISSIGTTAVDLSGVALASGISGKGLRSLAGLCLVFHDHPVASSSRLPRYLDLGAYAEQSGVPYTLCSNLLSALSTAVTQIDAAQRFEAIEEHARYIRARLAELGLSVLADPAHAAPAVITITLPRSISAARVGRKLADQGFLLSCNSEYLRKRNWIQICLMGQYTRDTIDGMLAVLGRSLRRAAVSAEAIVA